MKTCEEITEEYRKVVDTHTAEKDKQYSLKKDGTPKDPTTDLSVTDISGWDCYCSKRIYYNKKCKRPEKAESQLRFTIGHIVHEIPLWKTDDALTNGHEIAFHHDNIRCRMDEVDLANGIIVDKKTSTNLPKAPSKYVTEQLNIYKYIIENNKERPIKIKQLFVLTIQVTTGKFNVLEVPIWSEEQTVDFINMIRDDIHLHLENNYIPDVEYKSKGWQCEACPYPDLCMKDVPGEDNHQTTLDMPVEEVVEIRRRT